MYYIQRKYKVPLGAKKKKKKDYKMFHVKQSIYVLLVYKRNIKKCIYKRNTKPSGDKRKEEKEMYIVICIYIEIHYIVKIEIYCIVYIYIGKHKKSLGNKRLHILQKKTI